MKCKEIRFNLEPYLAGELFPAERAAVEEHLDACCSCRLEMNEIKEKINRIRLGKKGSAAKMPASLEKHLVKRLRHSAAAGKKRNILRYTAAAAVALALVMATVYSGTIAQLMEDMPFFQKYFSFGDKGVEHSLSLGAGQHIEASETADGITVTIHRLIADKNQTVILYSISAEAEADTAYIGYTLLDCNGRLVGTVGTHHFHVDLGIVTGQIRTVGIDELGERFQVRFKRIALQKTYTREVSFPAAGQINLAIPLVDGAGKAVGEYVLESAEVKDGYLHLSARYEMAVDERVFDGPTSDPGKQSYANPQIVSVYQGETPLSFRYSYLKLDGPDEYSYSLNQACGGDFWLMLAFEQPAAIAGEPVIFEIEIDRDLAAKHTYEKELGQRVDLDLEEGIYIDFKRLVSTASMTTIEYRVHPVQKFADGGYRIPDIMLSLYIDKARVEYQQNMKDIESGLYVISFDPALPLDSLSLSVDGYYRHVSAPLEFALTAADEGETVAVGGISLTVEEIDFDVYVDLEADWPFVMISYSSPVLAWLKDATVSDTAGTRKVYQTSHYAMWLWPPWQNRDAQKGFAIFSSDDTQWVIRAESYTLFTETNITITP